MCSRDAPRRAGFLVDRWGLILAKSDTTIEATRALLVRAAGSVGDRAREFLGPASSEGARNKASAPISAPAFPTIRRLTTSETLSDDQHGKRPSGRLDRPRKAERRREGCTSWLQILNCTYYWTIGRNRSAALALRAAQSRSSRAAGRMGRCFPGFPGREWRSGGCVCGIAIERSSLGRAVVSDTNHRQFATTNL